MLLSLTLVFVCAACNVNVNVGINQSELVLCSRIDGAVTVHPRSIYQLALIFIRV